MNVPQGYILACWVLADASGESNVLWLRRHEDRWWVDSQALTTPATGGKPLPALSVPFEAGTPRAEAFRKADRIVTETLEQGSKVTGHPAFALRVDVGSSDRAKIHRKLARSPFARAYLLGERIERAKRAKKGKKP